LSNTGKRRTWRFAIIASVVFTFSSE